MPEKSFDDLFVDADAAFKKKYKSELDELKGLSDEEIASVMPGTAGKEAHESLIKVVEDAAAQNLKQAQLLGNIKALGEVAINIAKKIPQFATLL